MGGPRERTSPALPRIGIAPGAMSATALRAMRGLVEVTARESPLHFGCIATRPRARAMFSGKLALPSRRLLSLAHSDT